MSGTPHRRRTRAAWVFGVLAVISVVAAVTLWLVLGVHWGFWIAVGMAGVSLLGLLILAVWWAIGRAATAARVNRKAERQAWRRYLRDCLRMVYKQNGGRMSGWLGPQRLFLVLGPPGHGKSALIRNAFAASELKSPENQPAAKGSEVAKCWCARVNERGASGIFVEVQSLARDPTHPAMLTDVLVAAQQERLPVRGVLLCVSAEVLLSSEGPLGSMEDVVRVVGEAVSTLERRLPIDLVVTKLDRIAGAGELFAELKESECPPLVSFVAREGSFDGDAKAWSDWIRQRRFAALVGGDARKTTLDDPDARERRGALFTASAQMERLFQRASEHAGRLQGRSEAFVRAIHFVSAEAPETVEAPTNWILDTLVVPRAQARHSTVRPLVPSSARALLRTALADHAPVAPSSSARRRSKLRWRAGAALASTVLVYSGVQLVGSAHGNHELLQEVASAVADVHLTAQPLAATDSFEKLERLEQLVGHMAEMLENGPPRSLRWGLFQGREIHADARGAFQVFVRTKVIRPIVQRTTERLRAFAAGYEATTDPPTDDHYKASYENLRSYLLLTDERARLAEYRKELAEDLAVRGEELSGGALDDLRLRPFMAAYLKLAGQDAWDGPVDSKLIADVRRVLGRAEQEEKFLAGVIERVNQKGQAVTLRSITVSPVFGSTLPAVEQAFTTGGWDSVHAQIEDPGQDREAWVLGDAWRRQSERAERTGRVTDAYVQQYGEAWYDFFRQVEVADLRSEKGAEALLGRLTQAGQEPLVALWTSFAANTVALEQPKPFSLVNPSQRKAAVVANRLRSLVSFGVADASAGAKKATETSLAHYHEALRAVHKALGVALDDVTKVEELKAEVGKAIQQTRTLVDSSNVSDEWRQPLLKLLLKPLEQLEGLLGCSGQRQSTLEWQAAVIDPMAALVNKYPFVAGEGTSASMEEIAKVFHPTTGAVTTFRDKQFTKLVVVSGDRIMPAPGGQKNAHLDPDVIELLNQSLRIGQALFEGEKPGVGFDLILECSSSIGQVTLTLDGKTVSTTCRDDQSQLVWPGEGEPRGAEAKFIDLQNKQHTFYGEGEWGLWRLLEKPRVKLERQDAWLLIHFDLPKAVTLRWRLRPGSKGAQALFLGQTLLAPFRESVFRRLPRKLFAGATCSEAEG